MKSRLRRITIGDRTYAWTVHVARGNLGFGLELRVWGAGKNSRQLRARLREHPRPGEVEQVIRYGLGHGWDPDGQGAVVDTGNWEHVSTGAGEPQLVLIGQSPRSGPDR